MKIKLKLDDVEISKIIAISIGWTDDRLDENGSPDPDLITESAYMGKPARVMVYFSGSWREFDYRDPLVTQALIEKFEMKTKQLRNSDWKVTNPRGLDGRSETLSGAVASLVISIIISHHLSK